MGEDSSSQGKMSGMLVGDLRLPARFWSKVSVAPLSGCWLWTGSTNGTGYGRFWATSRPDGAKLHYVHRYAYQMLVGPISEGLDLDHFRCGNRACCNPEHVRPVTRRENMLRSDSPAARNAAKTRCYCGRDYDVFKYGGARRCSTCESRRSIAAGIRYRQRHAKTAPARPQKAEAK